MIVHLWMTVMFKLGSWMLKAYNFWRVIKLFIIFWGSVKIQIIRLSTLCEVRWFLLTKQASIYFWSVIYESTDDLKWTCVDKHNKLVKWIRTPMAKAQFLAGQSTALTQHTPFIQTLKIVIFFLRPRVKKGFVWRETTCVASLTGAKQYKKSRQSDIDHLDALPR